MSKTKHVETVAKDIRELLVGVKTGSHKVTFDSPEFLGKFGIQTVKAFKKAVSPDDKIRPPNTFYASEVGSKCYRQLWYKYHTPALGEVPTASMSMKFMYGGIVEEVTLRLAELAGHKVTHEQEPVQYSHINGITIKGRIDAVIDGEAVVDVKSVSSYGFKDFQQGLGGGKFGYAAQLDFYKRNLDIDRHGTFLDKKGFLVVDKQLGHIEYCPETSVKLWTPVFRDLRNLVDNTMESPFDRLPTVAEGSNQKLGLECSYCAYKQECWKDANHGKGLRAFQYSGKVTWLTTVIKEPKVKELTGIIAGEVDGTN